MTYNFDPDRWYDNQRGLLAHRRDRAELTAAEFEAELERLEERYDEIVRRLDRPFELPKPQNATDARGDRLDATSVEQRPRKGPPGNE